MIDQVGFWEVADENPGGDWEMWEKKLAAEGYAQGRKVSGSVTAELRGRVPTALIARLPGLMDEHLLPNLNNDDKAMYIRESIRTEGVKQPIFVNVNFKGEGWINEGNHRTALSLEFGHKTAPVTIRYFAGGEHLPGPFNLKMLLNKYGKMPKPKAAVSGSLIVCALERIEKANIEIPTDELERLWEYCRGPVLEKLESKVMVDIPGYDPGDLHNRIQILGLNMTKGIAWLRERVDNAKRGSSEGWVSPETLNTILKQVERSVLRDIAKVEAMIAEAKKLLGKEMPKLKG